MCKVYTSQLVGLGAENITDLMTHIQNEALFSHGWSKKLDQPILYIKLLGIVETITNTVP